MEFSNLDVRDENGVLLVTATADMVLYFNKPYETYLTGLGRAWYRFLQLCGPQGLRWYQTYSMEEHKPVTDRTLGMLRGWLKPDSRPRDEVGFEISDAESMEAAPKCLFDLHVLSKRSDNFEDVAGHLRISLPPQDLEQAPSRFADLVVELASALPFDSGHAGYCLNVSEYGDTEAIAAAFPLLCRYEGFDVATVLDTPFDLRGGYIKGVNWLTLISASMLGRLGGKPALDKFLATTPTASVTKAGSGYVLQSSTQPDIGDRNRGSRADAYRATMAFVKPVLAPAYSCFSLPGPLAAEQSEAWFRRFVD